MNTISIIGVILIVLGVVGLAFGGITYVKHSNLIDAGDIHLQVDQKEQIPFSPIAGAAAVVLGVVLLFVGRRQPARA